MSGAFRTGAAAVILPLVIATSGACGRSHPAAAKSALPEKVNPTLAPASLGGNVTLHEDDTAKTRFAKLPKNTLVADGRLYSIRQGDRLVATLQLSTLMPEVDLLNQKRHDEVAGKLMPGVKEELQVSGVNVYQASGDDKTMFVWFGRHMFEVLQVKGSKTKPEDLLTQIITFQQSLPAWDPLPAPKEEF